MWYYTFRKRVKKMKKEILEIVGDLEEEPLRIG